MLHATKAQYDPLPSELITRLIDTVVSFVPTFDVQAARRALLRTDTLYEFSLPLSLDVYAGVAEELSAALERAGVPADVGVSAGPSPQPFVVVRNFTRID